MQAAAELRVLSQQDRSQVETRFDKEFGVYWGYMHARPRACFSNQLLTELRGFVDSIINCSGQFSVRGETARVRYAIIASKTPGVFSLGGDLALFRSAIVRRDREQLLNYGRQCVDNLFPWHRNCDLPLTTISLVQGEALGGGFECALASSVLVAEESSRMGFPEILFNLFPGMGAYSYLSRKVGRRVTEELITSGAVYSARQLYDLGIVDVIAPDGTGEAAVYSYIRRHSRCANGRRALDQVKNDLQPVTREELMRVVEIWADAALRLEERDLKMMDRLVRAQERSAASRSGQSNNVIPLGGAVAASAGG
jgi:DSF synthase